MQSSFSLFLCLLYPSLDFPHLFIIPCLCLGRLLLCLALFLSVYPFLTHIGTPSHPILWSSCSSSMLCRVSRFYFPSFSFSFHSEHDHCVLLSFVPPSSTAFVFSFLVLAVIEASVQTLAKVSSNVTPFHYSLLTLEVKGAQVYQTWAPKPSCSGPKRGLRMTMTCTSSVGSRCLPQALFCKSTKVMPQPSW